MVVLVVEMVVLVVEMVEMAPLADLDISDSLHRIFPLRTTKRYSGRWF